MAAARLLLVDGDGGRLAITRRWLEAAGYREPETAPTGDEALDILGAKAQRFDILAVWPPLPDDDGVDLLGVLRRCQSPVRAMAVTAFTPAELPRPGRLAGVALVDDSGMPRGFVEAVRRLLCVPDSVAAIIAAKRAPALLSKPWSEAIYGVPPGGRFHADLD